MRLSWISIDFKEISYFENHPLFDSEFYKKTYPSWLVKLNPAAHFCIIGYRRGYSPHPLFDTKYYFRKNPDVKRAKVNPLVHYLLCGSNEGRNPNPFFDTYFYKNTYLVSENLTQNPLEHYLLEGWKKGFSPSKYFDTQFYIQNNKMTEKDGCPLIHFITKGLKSGLSPLRTHYSSRARDLCLRGKYDQAFKELDYSFFMNNTYNFDLVKIRFKAVALSDHCQQENLILKKWRGEEVKINSPQVLSHSNLKFQTGVVQLEDPIFASIDNAIIVGASRVIIPLNQNYFLHPEINMVKDDYEHKLPFISKERDQSFILKLTTTRRESINSGLLISCDHTNNFFHWIVECLPKFYSVRDRPELRDVPLLISNQLHPNFIQALEILNLNKNPIIKIDPNSTTFVKKLFIAPDLSQVLDRYHGEISISDLVLSSNWIRKTMDDLKSRMNLKRKSSGRFFYFSRRKISYRNLVNQRELEKALVRIGFEIIYPEDYDFQRQVELVQEASVIVTPSGASCTHILFCQPKTEFFILNFYHPNVNLYLFNQMAEIADVRLSYILGKRTGKVNGKYEIHDDFAINVDKTVTLIQEKLAQSRVKK